MKKSIVFVLFLVSGFALTINAQDDFFFRILRASGEEDEVVVGDAGKLRQALRQFVAAISARAVELDRASDVDRGRLGAKREKSLGIVRILDCDQIDLTQHTTDQPRESAIAAKALLAQAAVDHGDLGPVLFRRGDQIGPQLQLGQDE